MRRLRIYFEKQSLHVHVVSIGRMAWSLVFRGMSFFTEFDTQGIEVFRDREQKKKEDEEKKQRQKEREQQRKQAQTQAQAQPRGVQGRSADMVDLPMGGFDDDADEWAAASTCVS